MFIQVICIKTSELIIDSENLYDVLPYFVKGEHKIDIDDNDFDFSDETELLEEIYDNDTLEAVIAVFDVSNVETLKEAKEFLNDNYQGKFENNESFAMSLIERVYGSLPSLLSVNWEITANNFMIGYSESNGHYFN